MVHSMKIDWSRSFLEPVTYSLTKEGLLLSAGGEEICFHGKLLSVSPDCADVSVEASALAGTMAIFSGDVHANRRDRIELVTWFDGAWENYDELIDYHMTYSSICTFLRKGAVSFFVSLDFPYSRADHGKISYDPFDMVEPGDSYAVYTVTVGAARLTGEHPLIEGKPGICDRGEIEAFSEYVERRYPIRFERPIYSTTCITNRMTDVREGRIFYSMYDNPTVALDPETLHREIDLCAELGIEYYQLFEGFFDFPDGIDCEERMRELTAHGRKVGVRVGGYMTPGGPYCPHYDYTHRDFGHPEWLRRDENGEPVGWHCLGSDYTAHAAKMMVEAAKRNGDEMICLDMWSIVPCFDPTHPHGPGSVFAEVRGLVRLMEALAEIGPEFLVWTNAGAFNEIAPKIAWYNPNMYLSDPHARQYSSSLSLLKYYGDCRREQMVTVHNKYFLPYRCFTNCEYYVFRHSRVDDTAFFEYSFLQGLCVTPNICLGELRTFLERIPASKLPYCKSFMREWLAFIRDNYDVWKHTFQITGSPGESHCELYAHVQGGEGFLCFVNQQHQSGSVSFTLDTAVGLSEGEKFLLLEEYPNKQLIAEQPIPYAAYGDSITVSVPAQSVRIIRIKAYAPAQELRLYGLQGEAVRTEAGYRLTVSGQIGETYPAAIALESAQIKEISAAPVPSVPMYTFPAGLSELTENGGLTRFALTMPRDRFCRELSSWSVDGGPAQRIDPLADGFRGAYLHNFYRETASVTLDVKTESGSDSPERLFPMDEPIPPATADSRGTVYETDFAAPFIEWGMAAMPYGYDEVLELVFANPAAVGQITASIDGKPCEVGRFYYPGRSMFVYHIELTGLLSSGTIPHLRLEITWTKEVAPAQKKEKTAAKTGAQILGQ